jgi:hypothetical protein
LIFFQQGNDDFGDENTESDAEDENIERNCPATDIQVMF